MRIFATTLASILLAGTSFAQTSQPQIFLNYKPSDRIIISDIAMRTMPNKSEPRPVCPGRGCDSLSNSWANSLNENDVDKRFLASVSSKPPHVQSQLLQAEFTARYQQLSNSYKDDICFDSSRWGLSNSKDAYFIGFQDRNLSYIETDYFNGTKAMFPASGGQFLNGIPNRFITEPVYARLQSLLAAGKSPSFIRACGKLTNLYFFPTKPGSIPDPEPVKMILTLSRPMEIMRAGEGPGLVLPFEWFQK